MTTVTIYWAMPADTDNDDEAKIYSDSVTPGTFETTPVATVAATSPYASVTTTLATAITKASTTIQFATGAGSSFAPGDKVIIGKEAVVTLGTEDTDTYSGCTRGIVPVAHEVGETVWKAHMSYADSVTWSTRYVRRYLVRANIDGTLRTGSRTTKFNPPAPPDNQHCCVYGLAEASIWQTGTTIRAGITVQCYIADGDNVVPASGASLVRDTAETTTDADGFWYFFLPKRLYQEGGDSYVITYLPANTDATGLETWTITDVPDQDSVHFMQIVVSA